MNAYQWIVRDNQQTCFPCFRLTPKHYSSRKEVEKSWGKKNTEYCFSVIEPLKMSRVTGRLAEALTKHEETHDNH